MDPFEARLQFIKSLQKLNGSIQANEAAIQFLLKNVDLEEDLYSCILQELDGVSIQIQSYLPLSGLTPILVFSLSSHR